MNEAVVGEVWSFLEVERNAGRLHASAVPMAAEARRLGRRLKRRPCGVIIGSLDGTPIEEALSQQGLEKLYRLDIGACAATPENHARALAVVAARHRPGHLLFAASARGCDLAARVAMLTGSGFIAQVVDYEGRRGEPLALRTSVFGDRVHRRMLPSGDRPWVFSIYPPSLATGRARSDGNMACIDVVDVAAERDAPGLRFDGVQSVPPAELDIREARVVVGVGRGIGGESNLALVRDFADRLGATIGGSRVAVEMGLIPVERQIGLSGKSLQADVYVACGISGASHHLMGIQAVRHVVAINRDPSAPLMKIADLALVGDLREILPRLIEKLGDGAKGIGEA
jgi:electron transfer flavoprotein alpha subunit